MDRFARLSEHGRSMNEADSCPIGPGDSRYFQAFHLGWKIDLETSVDSGKQDDFELVMTAFRETNDAFVFPQEAFVIWLLRIAKSFGAELWERAINALHASAVNGVRSGVPGKPFAKDLALRGAAEAVLSRIGRFEPAYELDDALLQDANADIAHQEKIGHAMDEEEN